MFKKIKNNIFILSFIKFTLFSVMFDFCKQKGQDDKIIPDQNIFVLLNAEKLKYQDNTFDDFGNKIVIKKVRTNYSEIIEKIGNLLNSENNCTLNQLYLNKLTKNQKKE